MALRTWLRLTMACTLSLLGSSCHPPECGDGEIEGDEECDDGNFVNGDGCSGACETEPVCGNLITEVGEECDDGNTISGDACRRDCILECGDGTVDPTEECDDGGLTPGDGCDGDCRLEWTPSVCGNGFVDPGETCDDGNTIAGDGCDASCQSEPVVCQAAATLACGDTIAGDTADFTDVFLDHCSRGTLEWTGPDAIYQFDAPATEEVVIALTGLSGDLDLAIVEGSCDALACVAGSFAAGVDDDLAVLPAEEGTSYFILVDGPTAATFDLRISCASDAVCGNGLLEGGEDCDDGNAADGDGCNSFCLVESAAALCQTGRPLLLERPGTPVTTTLDPKADGDSGSVTCADPGVGCPGGSDAAVEVIVPAGFTGLTVTFDQDGGEHVYALLTDNPTCAELDCVDPFPATAGTLTFQDISDGSAPIAVFLVVEACTPSSGVPTSLAFEPL